ncbi:DUF2269 family protein [Paenibacillus konkukensis]|uniref:DUF2269 family protein n=1 Tax=Paenibacillus konkukensis TaxID=2020716 RepID=UPI00201E644D|nr:DUF2269 family protein [Paenibacillus konkukensis]
MNWLVLLHVLSAIIGIGPTYFSHVLYRRRQSVAELKQSIRLNKMLDFFPVAGGSVAIVTGIALVALSKLHFLDLWIAGSLVIYILIQYIIVAQVIPERRRLREALADPALRDRDMLSAELQQQVASINKRLYAATLLGLLLFAAMIVKPELP